jgi:hypothetical protein
MTNLDIILGFRPRFLHFDLEDYATTYRVLPSDPSNEYYTLVQCCDSTPCTINGLPLRLVFSGKTSNNIHPDDLAMLVVSSVTDVNLHKLTGCYKLVEAAEVCNEETYDIPFEEFFFDYTCVKTCEECMPAIPPAPLNVIDSKKLFLDSYYNGLDPDKVESTMCRFADLIYKSAMEKKMGIKFCCMDDLMETVINHQLLKMDLVNNSEICCP